MESKNIKELIDEGYQNLQAGNLTKANEIFSSGLKQSISDKSILFSLYIGSSSSNYLLGNDCHAFYDACKAIEADPTQFEGYLRRANVFLVYSFYDEAIKDMKKAVELNKEPKFEQDLNSRVKFMEQFKQKGTQINIHDPQNILSAKIPDNLTLNDAKEIGKFIFDDKSIPKEDGQKLLTKLRETIENESKSYEQNQTIGRIRAQKVTVLGRIDGNYGKLYAFFDKNGYPSKENVYLVNGNFIGREDHKTLLILFLFKAAEPTSIYFTKGVFDNFNGFDISNTNLKCPNYVLNPLKCIEHFFGIEGKNEVEKIISTLPLCYIVNDDVAVTSCGLPLDTFSPYGQFSNDFEKTAKTDGFPFTCFSEEDVNNFLTSLHLNKLVLSSKVLTEGAETLMDGRVVSVSFGKTDGRVFGYTLGYATIRLNEGQNSTVEPNVYKFDFFPLSVAYDESNPYYEGLFFYLRKYTRLNPASAGFVKIQAISQDVVPVNVAIDTSINMYSYMSVPVPGSWIIIGFGGRKVKIDNYMIESAALNKNNDHMKSWKLLGSDDLENWTVIDERENVDELNGPFCSKVFDVQEDKRKFYKFVQILQHEKNHRGNWNLCLGHFDIFGKIE